QLVSSNEGAHQAMRDALPQLRHELQSAGLSSVDLSLDFSGSDGSNGSGSLAEQASQRPGTAAGSGQPADPILPARHDRPVSQGDSGLDRWL
ncbi:MAG: hypothetical protein ABI418_14100, partial [Jatrophihabitantaceae bacterium]